MNVDLLNNERGDKKPETWQAGARRVRLMRGLALPSITYRILQVLHQEHSP